VLLQFLLAGQEHALAHDLVLGVEQTVDRLEAEVRHAHVIRVRKRQRHAHTIAVRLPDVADLARQRLPRALTLLPALHGKQETKR
jgi:hypothetical protein